MKTSYDELIELLYIWRFAPSEDPRIQGDSGNAIGARLAELRRELGDEEWTKASKQVGWDNQ